MRQLTAALAAVVLAASAAGEAGGAQQRPPAGAPGTPPGAPGAPPAPAAPAPAAQPAVARVFSGSAGLLFNTVRADRVADFERVLGHLRRALETSTDPKVRAQAQGWKVWKAAEPGPNGTVLYVYVIDPVVPEADYGLGRILAEAITDPAQLQEVWRLYTGATTSGGTLLNLRAITPAAADTTSVPGAPVETPAATAPGSKPDAAAPEAATPETKPATPATAPAAP